MSRLLKLQELLCQEVVRVKNPGERAAGARGHKHLLQVDDNHRKQTQEMNLIALQTVQTL